jgi:hypothetical protein
MSKKEEEEIVLEQKPIVNGNMLEVLDKVLDFNSDYLAFLENELAVKKQQLLKEMEDNG